jgi:DNA-binding beta-propeller fold protein YncE
MALDLGGTMTIQRWLCVCLAGGVGIAACSSDPKGPESTESTTAAFSINSETSQEAAFTAFESGQVRPLALSPDGQYLYATNTPDNRLEIFRVQPGGLQSVASVVTGLEPVAVAARSPTEVWVVNHLSDSVSIVDVTVPQLAHVKQTLLVGDEPRDIVFARNSRAFITTAHRGQNTGRDPQLTTPGVGRADVWVFDPANLGSTMTGTPLTVITLFADTPRALAVSPDGSTVYAAAFESGNQTATVNERIVTPTAGMPPPATDFAGVPQQNTGLVVKYKVDPTDGNKHWLDNIGRRWDGHVMFSLPDKDVFAIDATANPPAAKPTGIYAGVGTTLFSMAVNPASGKVYVANTDALNDVRFEGNNVFAPTQGAPSGSVRGHIVDSRVTVLDASGNVTPRNLNPHIDYSHDGNPAEAALSLAFPTSLAVSDDGSSLLVTALGSAKLGIIPTAALEQGTYYPSAPNQVALTGGGPTGVIIDHRGHAYVLTRFDDGISTVDLTRKRETAHTTMFNPEPPSITAGRHFLYDANSTHGADACASCHIFGDFDSLAWDLGNPDNTSQPMPGPFTLDPAVFAQAATFQSLKGPMTTQSLRGLANHGPMHWRGDRTGGTDSTLTHVLPSAQPNTGTFDESIGFEKFNVAFPGLVGSAAQLSDADMAAFTNFMLQVTYPPNPIHNLDNSLTPDQQAGRNFFFSTNPDGSMLVSDTFENCVGCHVLDRNGNAQYGVPKPGFFGTDGRYSAEPETQAFKIPHLRNVYQKVGMFGMDNTFDPTCATCGFFLGPPYNSNDFMGDQVRGFGVMHDGSNDTAFRFHAGIGFLERGVTPALPPNPGGFPAVNASDTPAQQAAELQANVTLRRQVEAFVLAFDSNMAPIVGQQVTLTAASGADATARINLLKARAAAGEADLVVKGLLISFLYDPSTGKFILDRANAQEWPDPLVRALAQLSPLTFTAVPPGSGWRIAIDRDSDGDYDGDAQN